MSIVRHVMRLVLRLRIDSMDTQIYGCSNICVVITCLSSKYKLTGQFKQIKVLRNQKREKARPNSVQIESKKIQKQQLEAFVALRNCCIDSYAGLQKSSCSFIPLTTDLLTFSDLNSRISIVSLWSVHETYFKTQVINVIQRRSAFYCLFLQVSFGVVVCTQEKGTPSVKSSVLKLRNN